VADYILYCQKQELHPNLWQANAVDLYNWWAQRKFIQINGVQALLATGTAQTHVQVAGAINDAAVEVVIPATESASDTDLQVWRNDVLATVGTDYRRNGQLLKVRLDSTTTSLKVGYVPRPRAMDDDFTVTSFVAPTLVPAPGVLANDSPASGLTATAVESTPPGLTLNADGSITCSRPPLILGKYVFTYRAQQGNLASEPATATVLVAPANAFLVEDFTRDPMNPPLGDWTQTYGDANAWGVSAGLLRGAAGWGPPASPDRATVLYHPPSSGQQWGRYYSVEARVNMQGQVVYAGVAGQTTGSGERYAVYLAPPLSPTDYPLPTTMTQVQIRHIAGWGDTGWTPLATAGVVLAPGWHTLRVEFASVLNQPDQVQITVLLDGQTVLTDQRRNTGPDENTGVCVETANTHFASNPNDPGNPYGPGIDVLVDSVIVAPLAP
jgi:hypothetical protein